MDQIFHERLFLDLFKWFILSDCSILQENNTKKAFWSSVKGDHDCLIEVKITMGNNLGLSQPTACKYRVTT